MHSAVASWSIWLPIVTHAPSERAETFKPDLPRWRYSMAVGISRRAALELLAVPLRARRARDVRALEKLEQRGLRRRGGADDLVREDEATHRRVPERARRIDVRARVALGRRRVHRVEGRLVVARVARPEAGFAHFVRESLALDRPARRLGGSRARISRGRQIEGTPVKADGARLPDEARPEVAEHALGVEQDAPEARDPLAIVDAVDAVLAKWNRLAHDLDRLVPNRNAHADRRERVHELRVEIGDRAIAERQLPSHARVGADDEHVVDEVELHVERPIVVRERVRGET